MIAMMPCVTRYHRSVGVIDALDIVAAKGSFTFVGALVCGRDLHASRDIYILRTQRGPWQSGCLGGCARPTPIIAVDEPSKRLKFQGQSVKRPRLSDDFGSTSTYEMDNSTAPSQRSMSSISVSNPNPDIRGTNSNSTNTEFVSHGLNLWNETRQQWVGDRPQNLPRQPREPVLSWTATYDSLLGSHRPFPRPVPLSEMVEFLVDVWEQEGLYD